MFPRVLNMLISQVNRLSFPQFIQLFGNVVEECPIVAAAAWSQRPFKDLNSLYQCIEAFINQLPLRGKVGILRCFSDVGKGTTDESVLEQKAAGIETLTFTEKLQLEALNTRYKDKFGFPFLICARQNKKEAILKGLVLRVNNTADVEISTGIEEVKKICRLRLESIVSTTVHSSL